MKPLATALLMAIFPLVVCGETLKIATFNAEFLNKQKIHMKFGLPFDLSSADELIWDAPGFRDTKYTEAVAVVADVIKDIDTDVLTLTEVGKPAEVAELAAALAARGVTYPNVAVGTSTDKSTGQHVAILSKLPMTNIRKKIPGREGYQLEEDDADEQKDTGISKGMIATVTKDGQEIDVFVVHLASERGGHEKDAQRIAQASIVRRTIIPLLNQGRHVILTGDMNDRRGQPTLKRLRGLDDIWPDLIQTGHWSFFERATESSRWTYRFRGELNQIDHILVSFSLRKSASSGMKSEVMDVPEPASPPTVSDHRPLIVSIELP